MGEDPGPAKLDKARGYNIPEITEDDLLDMILTKSGMEPKYSKHKSNVSEESGIELDVKKFEEKENEKKDRNQLNEEISNGAESKSSKKNKSSDKSNLKKLNRDKEETKKPNICEQRFTKEKVNTEPKESKVKEAEVDTKLRNLEKAEKNKMTTSKLENMEAWTEKYKPKDIKSIIGQQDSSSNMNKLKKWLSNWYKNQLPEVRKKIPRPSPWAHNDDGAYYKAALLSGSPGVGIKFN